MPKSKFKSIRYTKRWFCYIDLLGFSNLVNSSNISGVITTYLDVLDKMEGLAGPKKNRGIYYSWFSDTFIIYSRGPSTEYFVRIEQISRLFFQKLVFKGIPARGALTFGPLYSHLNRNIFVGPALIDAHHYGEAQNWIGFVLTPNAVMQLSKDGLDAKQRPFYKIVDNRAIFGETLPDEIYAFAFNNGRAAGAKRFLKHILKMKHQSDPKYHNKYDATERFLRLHNPGLSPID